MDLSVTYDNYNDVLYVFNEEDVELSMSNGDKEGLIVKIFTKGNGAPHGMTIFKVRENWGGRVDELEAVIGEFMWGGSCKGLSEEIGFVLSSS